MDENQALVEAYPYWWQNEATTRGMDLYEDPPLRLYDAEEALRALERDTMDDPFWEIADWIGLKRRFISYIDYRLQLKNTTYDQVMEERRQAILTTS